MTKPIAFFSLLFLMLSCQQTIQPTDIGYINGYWEIEKVVFAQGEDKEYKINESYDYFEIGKNNKGFRKKVMPQLDGTFIVNNTFEKAVIRFENKAVFIDYSTDYGKWSEEIVQLTTNELVLSTSDNNKYYYKKASPINILGNGKKTK